MTREVVKVEGLSALLKGFDDISEVAAKGVLKRTLQKAAYPVARRYAERVRVLSGALRDSVLVTDRLTRRQAGQHLKASEVEMHIGPGGLVQAITEEFGTPTVAPQGALRATWDAEADPTLQRIQTTMTDELDKSIRRARARR